MAETPVQPADVLEDLMSYVPELSSFANLEVKVPFNVDSSRVGPKEWTMLAKLLHKSRAKYDAFLVHTAATASTALSSLSLRAGGRVGWLSPWLLRVAADCARYGHDGVHGERAVHHAQRLCQGALALSKGGATQAVRGPTCSLSISSLAM
jgi:hypothetical protein